MSDGMTPSPEMVNGARRMMEKIAGTGGPNYTHLSDAEVVEKQIEIILIVEKARADMMSGAEKATKI